tara:strand:+ start:246 stop:647 length:402 start_codon:yes stop_codon:yes gene_type:complete
MTSKPTNLTKNILAPVSLGELIDKITILEIKSKHMTGIKQKHVDKELQLLKCILEDKNLNINIDLVNDLKKINNSLWVVEDQIRLKENKHEFDQEFIKLARSVYKKNDIRASIKKEINQKYNSELIEEKSYNE